jgi:pimeloyl-ACP methyl ester carboxylesterase
MHLSRRTRRLLLALLLYVTFCAIIGVFIADAALHPARRPLTDDEVTTMRAALGAKLDDVSITTSDQATLRAWLIHPNHANGNAVLLLHGVADNRIGMTGYAQLFLSHGFEVLLPDARAHGASGGELATYGLLERNDIHQWLDFLETTDHSQCIFGFGESMGAAELLQSLDTHPHFCAVAAESPFANFREIAYDRMGQPFHLGPWLGRTLLRPVVEIAFLRARWKYGLDMSKVSPENSVAASHTPVFLIHGQIDSNIPVRHSRLIHAAAPATQLWEVPNADHCGAIGAAPEEFQSRVLRWLTDHPRSTIIQIIPVIK